MYQLAQTPTQLQGLESFFLLSPGACLQALLQPKPMTSKQPKSKAFLGRLGTGSTCSFHSQRIVHWCNAKKSLSFLGLIRIAGIFQQHEIQVAVYFDCKL